MGILLKPSSSGALEREKASEFIHVSNTSESAALAGRTLGFPVKGKISCREKDIHVNT